MPTRSEFIQTIKNKYPVYAEIEDHILFDAIIKKYPVYKELITDINKKVKIVIEE